jgi:hypothetical protein
MFFLGVIVQWFTYFWWIWLFLVAWWYYSWAREHLAFSPLLTLVVGGILVYYLVIEHPFIGSFGMVFWVLVTSGVLWLMPVVSQLFNTIIPGGRR